MKVDAPARTLPELEFQVLRDLCRGHDPYLSIAGRFRLAATITRAVNRLCQKKLVGAYNDKAGSTHLVPLEGCGAVIDANIRARVAKGRRR